MVSRTTGQLVMIVCSTRTIDVSIINVPAMLLYEQIMEKWIYNFSLQTCTGSYCASIPWQESHSDKHFPVHVHHTLSHKHPAFMIWQWAATAAAAAAAAIIHRGMFSPCPTTEIEHNIWWCTSWCRLPEVQANVKQAKDYINKNTD